MRHFMFRVSAGSLVAIWLVAGLAGAANAQAQSTQDRAINTDSYPYSIMVPERGTRAKPAKHRQNQKVQRAEPSTAEKPAKAERSKRRIGSSSPPAPPPQSIVTPLGVAPRIIEAPPVTAPSSPSMIVPGISGNAGPAVTPPRPPGQSFHDRAVNCVHYGTSQGVPPGQIGAYTRDCVNAQ
jgi:hypothetical protein